MFVIGVFVFLIGSALSGFCWTMKAHIMFRFIQGIKTEGINANGNNDCWRYLQ